MVDKMEVDRTLGVEIEKMSQDSTQDFQPPGVVEWAHLDKQRFYLLAPIASLATRAAVYPSNLVKTRLQSQTKSVLYTGTWDAFRKIIKNEGFPALYKGFVPNSFGVIASQIYITTFEFSRHVTSLYTTNELIRNCLPGGLASLISQSVTVPADIISQRMMVHGQGSRADSAQPKLTARTVLADVLRTEGMRGLTRGYWASIFTFAPSSAIWWAVYGHLRSLQIQRHTPGDSHLLAQSLAGGAAGAVTAVVTNPLDTIRTRVQLAQRTAGQAITVRATWKALLRDEGWRGLMNGATARVLHTAPNSVLMIAAYETVKRWSMLDTAGLTA